MKSQFPCTYLEVPFLIIPSSYILGRRTDACMQFAMLLYIAFMVIYGPNFEAVAS